MSNDKVSTRNTNHKTAEDLRNFDWSDMSDIIPSQTDSSKSDCNLKQQYQKNMLERYPEFEVQTVSDITELKHQVSRLSDMNKMMVWLVLGLIVMLTITQIN